MSWMLRYFRRHVPQSESSNILSYATTTFLQCFFLPLSSCLLFLKNRQPCHAYYAPVYARLVTFCMTLMTMPPFMIHVIILICTPLFLRRENQLLHGCWVAYKLIHSVVSDTCKPFYTSLWQQMTHRLRLFVFFIFLWMACICVCLLLILRVHYSLFVVYSAYTTSFFQKSNSFIHAATCGRWQDWTPW